MSYAHKTVFRTKFSTQNAEKTYQNQNQLRQTDPGTSVKIAYSGAQAVNEIPKINGFGNKKTTSVTSNPLRSIVSEPQRIQIYQNEKFSLSNPFFTPSKLPLFQRTQQSKTKCCRSISAHQLIPGKEMEITEKVKQYSRSNSNSR